jgi:hypothetical protein
MAKKIIMVGLIILGLITLSACAASEYNSFPSKVQEVQSVAIINEPKPIYTQANPPVDAQKPVISNPTSITETLIIDPTIVSKNLNKYMEVFREKIKTTNWIRRKFTIIYFDNIKEEYRDPQVKEEWYLFGPEEQLVESYNWVSSSDGVVQQEAVYLNGSFYNITLGGSGHSNNTKVDFSGSFLDNFQLGQNIKQEAVTYHGVKAWKFSFEIEEEGIRTVSALFFDQQSSLIIGEETYLEKPDGSLQIVSGIIISNFDLDATPPVERFQQMLEKAQRLH